MQCLQYPPASPSETILEASLSPDSLPDFHPPSPLHCPFTSASIFDDGSSEVPAADACDFVGGKWRKGRRHKWNGSGDTFLSMDKRPVARTPQTECGRDGDGKGEGEFAANSAMDTSTKKARMPQSMGFHFDWWIARLASTAQNVCGETSRPKCTSEFDFADLLVVLVLD